MVQTTRRRQKRREPLLLNKMFTSLSSLSVITDADKLIAKTEELVSNKAKKIEAVQSHMREFSFTESDYESLQEITAASFLEEVFEEIRNQIEASIEKIDNMWLLSVASSEMVEFCHEEEIALPDSKEDKMQEVIAGSGTQNYLSYKVLGNKAEYFSKVLEKKEIMSAIIKKKIETALNGGINVMLLYPGSDAFNEYFSKSNKSVKKYKNEVIAILDDKSFLFDTDILFTTTSLLIVERGSLKEICSYDSVDFDVKTNKLMIGSVNYRNNNIDTVKMNEALVELKHSSKKR